MKNKSLYLAYGSNMNLKQMSFRCPDAIPTDSFYLEGYELNFKGKGTYYATLDKNENSKVPVTLWAISEDDELNLDRYEGYPTFYRKEYFNLHIDGEDIEVMVYLMNSQEFGQPSQEYINTIASGYKSAGFSPKSLYDFLKQSNMKVNNRTNSFEIFRQFHHDKNEIDYRKQNFKDGDIIELKAEMEGETGMPVGLKGVVKHVDDVGTIHVNWQNGRTLGVTLKDHCSKVEGVIASEEIDETVQDEGIDNGMELM